LTEEGISQRFRVFTEKIREAFEKGLDAELSKRSFFERTMFQMVMPLIINLSTDLGVASLTVLKEGKVKLDFKLSDTPDVSIEADFEALNRLYESRDKSAFHQAEANGQIKINAYTFKGQQTEQRLRELLGYQSE